MKIGIAIWQGRVSPVFDAATTLKIVEVHGGQATPVKEVPIPRLSLWQKAKFINQLHVDVIICGAISRFLSREIQALNIAVQPWIRGSVADVLAAYQAGTLHSNGFMLPGCRGGRGRNRRRGGRELRGFRRGTQETEERS